MGAEPRQIDQDAHELRALLVRFLVEASPGDPRLSQVLTAMEQVVRLAREGQDLATLKSDLGKMRKVVEDTSQPALLHRIEELLARSDSQLTTLIAASEARSLAQLAKLDALVSELTKRVQNLEAQVQKLSSGR